MTSCSPAEWGLSRDGLCRARTGAPRWGDPNPPPQTQGPRRGHVEYWKAQCEETRMLRLEGGKERKLLPILTVSKSSSATRWHPLLSPHPNGREDAREHDFTSMSRRSKLHGADLPSTSPSCADCKKRGAQQYHKGSAHPPFNVAVPHLL